MFTMPGALSADETSTPYPSTTFRFTPSKPEAPQMIHQDKALFSDDDERAVASQLSVPNVEEPGTPGPAMQPSESQIILRPSKKLQVTVWSQSFPSSQKRSGFTESDDDSEVRCYVHSVKCLPIQSYLQFQMSQSSHKGSLRPKGRSEEV